MSRSLTLTMPYPPVALSPNASVHRMVRAKAKAQYRADCGWAARAQIDLGFVSLVRVRLWLRFVCCRRQLPDPDNAGAMAKPLLDALVDVHILPDDRAAYVVECRTTVEKCGHVWVKTCREGDRVIVTLREV